MTLPLRELTQEEAKLFLQLKLMSESQAFLLRKTLVKKGGWVLRAIEKRLLCYDIDLDSKSSIMILYLSHGIVGKAAKMVDDIAIICEKLKIKNISYTDFCGKIYPMGVPDLETKIKTEE